jgi:hypothetical protein
MTQAQAFAIGWILGTLVTIVLLIIYVMASIK